MSGKSAEKSSQSGEQPGQTEGNEGKPGGQSGKSGDSRPGQGEASAKSGAKPGQGGEPKPGGQPSPKSGNEPGKAGNQSGKPGGQPGQGEHGGKSPNGQDQADSNEMPNSGGNIAGRGGQDGNDPGTNNVKDNTQPLPPVTQKSANGEDSVAPDSAKPNLVLRKLQDLLKDDKFTPDVEKKLGMSREEAEQFVKKFENRQQPGPAGPGRTIEAKPEKERVFDPNRAAPKFETKATASNRASRTGTTIPQDNLSGLSEGAKSAPPIELRKKFEAYMKGVANSKSTATTSPPASNR